MSLRQDEPALLVGSAMFGARMKLAGKNAAIALGKRAVRGGLRIAEVPVEMRLRSAGRSSITNVGSVYYVLKVLLALFIGLLPQGKVVKR
jgi:hypothetical protein